MVEIKPTVLVTLRSEAGEPARYLYGELVRELPSRGNRRVVRIRVQSTTNVKDLIIGRQIDIPYLPEERRDIHKERADWNNNNWQLTLIDNGVLRSDGTSSDMESEKDRRIKLLEAQVSGYKKDRDDLADTLTGSGTMKTVEHILRQIEFTKKRLREGEEEKEKIIREGEKKV